MIVEYSGINGSGLQVAEQEAGERPQVEYYKKKSFLFLESLLCCLKINLALNIVITSELPHFKHLHLD